MGVAAAPSQIHQIFGTKMRQSFLRIKSVVVRPSYVEVLSDLHSFVPFSRTYYPIFTAQKRRTGDRQHRYPCLGVFPQQVSWAAVQSKYPGWESGTALLSPENMLI